MTRTGRKGRRSILATAQEPTLPRLPDMPPVSGERRHDVFDQAERSAIMQRVRSKGNRSTEIKLIEVFKSEGIKGWRRNVKLCGKPDFLFPKRRVAIFVDGCFWHGHDCRNTKPKDHEDYWRAKIERNRARDAATTERLQKLGYCVIRIWECELKRVNRAQLLEKLAPTRALTQEDSDR